MVSSSSTSPDRLLAAAAGVFALPQACSARVRSLRSRLPAAGRTSRLVAVHQCLLHTFEQSRLVERLAQKIDGAGVQRAISHPLVRKGGNENGGDGMAGGYQMVLQFDAAHAGHLHICNEAGGFA